MSHLKIVLAGGGTGGPTSPLLAVVEKIKKLKPDSEFLFIGTATGPERELVEYAGIRFVSIPAGKLRRYFSLSNIADFFRTWRGYAEAKKILKEFKPDLVFSVGSFVAVPVCFAARKLGVKIVIHQQDARIGLANRLVAPFAEIVTTAFEQTAKEFKSKTQALWVGNPVREEFFSENNNAANFFNLKSDLPKLLIFGGASGASQINEVVAEALPELIKAHEVIHVTGRGKKIEFSDPNYRQYEFLTEEMAAAMKIADIVVARAGLSTIAELSALGKVSIIIPMPGSHQEDNARILKEANAAVVLSSEEFTPEALARIIVSLKFNQKRQELLSANMKKLMPHDSAERLAKLILEKFAR